MSRKATALFALAAFVLFSASCTTWRTKAVYTPADYPGPNKKVLSVVKTSGEVVEFSKEAPGRVWGGAVIGATTVVQKTSVEIDGPYVSVKKRADGTIYEVTDAKGQVHTVLLVLKEEPNKLTAQVRYPVTLTVSIPLSDLRSVQIRRIDVGKTALGVVGVYLLGTAALMLFLKLPH